MRRVVIGGSEDVGVKIVAIKADQGGSERRAATVAVAATSASPESWSKTEM